MTQIIDKKHTLYQKLLTEYLKDPKVGYVSLGDKTYRVLKPSDDDIKFLPLQGLDDSYSSLSV